MGKRILITGVGGFVGKNLVRYFAAEEGCEILGIDLLPSFKPIDQYPLTRFHYQTGNFWEKGLIERLISGDRFDIIIHLAAVLSQGEDFDTHYRAVDTNMKATFLVLEIAKAHNARLIFPSTGLIYGNQPGPFTEAMEPSPADFYSFSKHLSENAILYFQKRFGIRPVIFRPAILYGPGQSETMFIPTLLRSLLDGKEFPMTKGEQNRDFVFIDDFVAAVGEAVNRDDLTGIFNIGTETRWRLIDVALLAEKLANMPGKVKPGALPYRSNESWDYCVSAEKMFRQTGWRAHTGLEEGLRKTMEWIRAHSNSSKAFV